jgi:DNA primase
MPTTSPLDWSALKATLRADDCFDRLLGEPEGRRGNNTAGRRWWVCPLHGDRNPSFTQTSGQWSWHCFGCGKGGDIIDLARELNAGWGFRDAVAFLTGDQLAPTSTRPTPRPVSRKPKSADDGPPSMLEPEAALDLVRLAEDALWSEAGSDALDYLRSRGLSDETIRRARLGWTPRLPLKGQPEGITIPWECDGQLEAVNLRQPDGRRPKYRKVFHAAPTIFPDPEVIEPGRPLVIVEGELDALLVGQEIGDLASVVTLGSASARPTDKILWAMLAASPWIIGVDNDEAGAERARQWADLGRRCIRVAPPEKDWGEVHVGGRSRIRYYLGAVLSPVPAWEELEPLRWNPELEGEEPAPEQEEEAS